jgi:O-antigen ligase
VALFLLVAIAMTGSRAGVALITIACAGAALIFSMSRSNDRRSVSGITVAVATLVLLLGCVAALAALSQNTAIARVTERFSDLGSERSQIWQDSWFALKQYWPVGFGMGGFEPAMLPAERLEYLDALVPNRAHNDFLEIGIEAGILGYAMVVAAAAACLALARRGWRAAPEIRGQIVFAFSVLMLIAFHSLVDYPLRSMAVASLCGVAGGLLVRPRKSTRSARERGRLEVIRGLA